MFLISSIGFVQAFTVSRPGGNYLSRQSQGVRVSGPAVPTGNGASQLHIL